VEPIDRNLTIPDYLGQGAPSYLPGCLLGFQPASQTCTTTHCSYLLAI